MARSIATFREKDITRVVRAVEAAGKFVTKVVINPASGQITVEAVSSVTETANTNEWDVPPARQK